LVVGYFNFLLEKVVFFLGINLDFRGSFGASIDSILDEKPTIKFDPDAYFRDDKLKGVCFR